MSEKKQKAFASEVSEEILTAIDRGTWKHSWHLPRDQHGYVIWRSQHTLDKCKEVLERQIVEANRIISANTKLLDSVQWKSSLEDIEI